MSDAWRSVDAYLGALGIRYGSPTVGQTTGGTHAPGSLHYSGRARDYGRSQSDMPAIISALLPFAEGPDHLIQELFGLGVFWKSGRVITPSTSLRTAHQDHVHVGLRAGKVMPRPAPKPKQEEPAMPDDPARPNITGPVELHLVVGATGVCTGYYLFSPTTAELHGYGPGAQFHGTSEVTPRAT